MKTTIGRLGFFALSITASVFTVASAHAFSKERCGKLFPQAEGDHPYYYSPIYVTTMMPSTTSYFSSVGPCSMYGDYQSATRASFIEDSLPKIRVDAARGSGEYLKALAQLSGCPEEQYGKVASVMHSRFSTIFAANDVGADVGAEALSQSARIDSALRSETALKNSCPGLN